MKNFLILLGILAAVPCFAESGTVIGKVAELSGSALGGSAQLAAESPVHAGDRITTAAGSRARILFDDQSAIQLGAETEIKVVRVGKGATVIHLVRGGVLSRVKPQPKKSITPRFMVRTKSAVMGVRGTTFFVRQDAAKPAFLCVCEGTVDVTWHGHKTTRTSHHHDAPVWLDQTQPSLTPESHGPAHDDADIAALGTLLGASRP
jgi:ferric-dicitrate binding protein FerR (iron transport regulator)